MKRPSKNPELQSDVRLEKVYERLGTRTPKCLHCLEDDPRCLELHHVAGRKFNDETVIECRNCHRKLSDLQKDHPDQVQTPPHPLECIGHFLLGVADLLKLLIGNLQKFGLELIALASNSPAQGSGGQS